jgi:hypothetical protein
MAFWGLTRRLCKALCKTGVANSAVLWRFGGLGGLAVPVKCRGFRMRNTSLVEHREIRIEANISVTAELSALRCRETRTWGMSILKMEKLVSDAIAR